MPSPTPCENAVRQTPGLASATPQVADVPWVPPIENREECSEPSVAEMGGRGRNGAYALSGQRLSWVLADARFRILVADQPRRDRHSGRLARHRRAWYPDTAPRAAVHQDWNADRVARAADGTRLGAHR